jgi:predicted PurR-regulated permease PerM
VRDGVGSGEGNLGGTVVRTATTAGHLLAGLFIVLFATIFFTYDGRNIWSWIVRLFPDRARARVEGSGVRAWAVLTSYVRATVVIAAVDALGIAIVALVLGLPLVVPLAVLVFMGAFIPVVGATISGIAAVAVALVSEGPVQALIMLAGVIGVQQLEGHVLQPFLMGRLVRVHPLAVVVVIAIGGLVAGIFGALIAVPLTAIVNAVATYLAGERRLRLEQESGAAADPALTP